MFIFFSRQDKSTSSLYKDGINLRANLQVGGLENGNWVWKEGRPLGKRVHGSLLVSSLDEHHYKGY